MEIQAVAEMMYRLQTFLTSVELLFAGKWWAKLMKRSGIEDFHGLVMRAHNELVVLRGGRTVHGETIAWDYRPFYSAQKRHRMFEDPMHQCGECQQGFRKPPRIYNIVLKKFGLGKWKHAILLAVD